MSIHIEAPTQGGVTLKLSYHDAEILLRAVGLVNTGSLLQAAPQLLETVDTLLEEFGRNTNLEASRYVAEIINNQIYITDLQAD